MAYTSVFPYLPDMIQSFGVKETEVARWAGITSGVFSISQSLTAVAWGKASDVYGRKPTVIFGLLATMTCFIAWGMSTSLTMAITVRAIQGGGNGNVGIIRTMVAEMVPQRELQPRAFSIMPLVWSVGSVLGPSFGGFFANPAKQFPELFGNNQFFIRFPFLLPNLLLTICFLISATSAIFFLKETLPSKRDKRDWGLVIGQQLTQPFRGKAASVSSRRRSFVDGEATAPLLPAKTLAKPTKARSHSMKEVFTTQTVINLLAYTFVAFHSVSYDQTITVFLHHPVIERTPENFHPPFYFNSGFGLSTGQIGTMFTLYGIVCAFIQFLVYPPLVSRFGVLRCFKVCTILVPLAYFLTPYTVLLPTQKTRLIALLIVMFFKGAVTIVSFPSITILLTNSASSLSILGTLNGFATAFSGVGRAVGPASTGAMFTWGAEHGYIVASWFFLVLIAIIGAIPVFMIVEGAGPTASVENSDAEDSDSSAASTLLGADGCAISDDSESDDDCKASRRPQSYGTMGSQR